MATHAALPSIVDDDCPQYVTHEEDGHGHQGWVIVNLVNGATIEQDARGIGPPLTLYQDLGEARKRAAELRAGDELHAVNEDIYVYALAPVEEES